MAKFNLENVIVESVDSKENVKNIFLELISKEPQENNIYIDRLERLFNYALEYSYLFPNISISN